MSGEGKAASWIEVSEEEAGQRIDNYLLARLKGVPKSHVYRVLRSGEVRVNSVCPAPIDTPLLVDFRKTMTDKIIDWTVSQTNQRLVTPREVANVLAFLASDAASYVNGVNLNVDAGFNAALTTGQVDFSGLA